MPIEIRSGTLFILFVVIAGCSSKPGAVKPPSFEPTEAADAAIRQYDKNGDHSLQQKEWSACAAIASSIDDYDSNSDKVLTSEEIAAGLRRWQAGDMGARPMPFQVKLGGQAIEGAKVRLIPEEFLGQAVKPAEGVTGPGGRGFLGVSKEDLPPNAPSLPLVQPGLYRVEVTHPRIKVPSKYNAKTILGLEVASDRQDPRGVVWDLDY